MLGCPRQLITTVMLETLPVWSFKGVSASQTHGCAVCVSPSCCLRPISCGDHTLSQQAMRSVKKIDQQILSCLLCFFVISHFFSLSPSSPADVYSCCSLCSLFMFAYQVSILHFLFPYFYSFKHKQNQTAFFVSFTFSISYICCCVVFFHKNFSCFPHSLKKQCRTWKCMILGHMIWVHTYRLKT